MIKYIGTSHSRHIFEADWKRIGIEQPDVTWDASNGYEVDENKLNSDAVAYLANSTDEWEMPTRSKRKSAVDTELPFEPELMIETEA